MQIKTNGTHECWGLHMHMTLTRGWLEQYSKIIEKGCVGAVMRTVWMLCIINQLVLILSYYEVECSLQKQYKHQAMILSMIFPLICSCRTQMDTTAHRWHTLFCASASSVDTINYCMSYKSTWKPVWYSQLYVYISIQVKSEQAWRRQILVHIFDMLSWVIIGNTAITF